MADRTEWFSSEAELTKFKPTRVLDHYFDRMLAMFAQRGIKVYFVGAPLNQRSTHDRLDHEAMGGFVSYLESKAAKDPNFRILGSPVYALANDYFGDVEHVNLRGSAVWSASVAELLKRSYPRRSARSPRSSKHENARLIRRVRSDHDRFDPIQSEAGNQLVSHARLSASRRRDGRT